MKSKIPLQILKIDKGNYHLFVDLEINKVKCRLLVDTGASKTVFDKDKVLRFTEEDQIHKYEMKSLGLGAEDMETEIAVLKQLHIGKIRSAKMEVAILDLSHVNRTYAALRMKEIDGVLGSDVMRKLKAVINYGRSVLTLDDGK